VLVRRWYDTRRFLDVGVLMLREVDDLNILALPHPVPKNERGAVKVILEVRKFCEQYFSIEIVVWKEFAFDVRRPILKTTLAIAECPQSLEH
jgi:hypothetical protein